MFSHGVRAAMAALSITIASLMPFTASTALAQTGCGLNNSNQHVIVLKNIDDVTQVANPIYFSHVRGDVTVRRIDPCDSNLGLFGYANIVPVTMEGGGTYQAGVQFKSGVAAPKFVYTCNSTPSTCDWPGELFPILGERYRFAITRIYDTHTGVNARYTITWLGDGFTTSETAWSPWVGQPTLAWWGTERQNPAGDCGTSNGTSINMAYMGYSVNNLAFNGWYRTGMSSSDIYDTCSGAHGIIGTWVYGGDKLNVTSP